MDDKEVTVICNECDIEFMVIANQQQRDLYKEVNCECPNCGEVGDNQIMED
jgi:hypothetical protein